MRLAAFLFSLFIGIFSTAPLTIYDDCKAAFNNSIEFNFYDDLNWLNNNITLENFQFRKPCTLEVNERSLSKTNWAEAQLLEPAGFQAKIDEAVKKASGIRSFVRPSGTENIVRVYAEAETEESTKALGGEIAALVRQISG